MNETELLFSEVLGCDRASLYLNRAKNLRAEETVFISAALKRRIKGEPIQYILGKTEFMGWELKVNPDVLIPRPETEILVERALKYAAGEKCIRILDLGTGSGCIAISLQRNLADARIDASDISAKALEAAEKNAGLNSAKINFIRSDLFAALDHKQYDMIISNPPYIASAQIRKLQPELSYEPVLALDGGSDGLSFYRRIIPVAPGYLKRNALLIMEIGCGQLAGLKKIFLGSGKFELMEVIKDYNNIERVIVARKV